VIESTEAEATVRTSNGETASVSGAMPHDSVAVHTQLAKVLGSAHFRNSKRSQALLSYVVGAALGGDQQPLKERCIGTAVFGRATSYDTGQDPVVRNAAIEVRKRLAQYYMEPDHAAELRIELPLGSYLPGFIVETPAEPPAAPTVPAVRRRKFQWVAPAALAVVLVALAALLWSTVRTPKSELRAFWEPLFRDGKPIQICIGQPTRVYRFTGPRSEELNRLLGGSAAPDRDKTNLSIAAVELSWVAPEYLFLRDALAGFKVASWIQSQGQTHQLMSVAQTNYSQLRHQPLVAIGAFNNSWSMRVTAELRFVFDRRTVDGLAYSYIKDRRNPTASSWSVPQPASSAMTEDYAIVTRVFDPATERTVISAAGVETFGTVAASEFVTEPAYLGAALQALSREWRRKNVQFVLGTRIIDGAPGPPRVLATNFW